MSYTLSPSKRNTVYAFILCILLSCISFFLFAHSAFANDATQYIPDASVATDAGLPTENQSPSDIVINGIRLVMQILGIVALVLIIYAGLTMLISGGNSEKIGQAKNFLIWTVIGAIVILSSLGILEFIDATLFS